VKIIFKIVGQVLASSVSVDGEDDSNLLFTDLLGRLSKVQVIILNYSCETADKYHSRSGLIFAGGVSLSLKNLVDLSGTNDIHRIDRELDYLREVGLIRGGFDPVIADADISPNALALQMYVRGQGYVGSPTEYFNTKEADPEKVEGEWFQQRQQKLRESQQENSA